MSVCPSCAEPSAAGARFCSHCGAELTSPAGRHPTVERKVVTCLFCDLIDSTPLSEAADPEDVDRLLSEYARVARHAVEIHGGAVEKYIGDAVVAVFGVPATHEDDAERAIHAAVRIVHDVAAVHGPDGDPIHVRIGINTGEALARVRVPFDSGERLLAGDAVNTAARLQTIAPPDSVLVGPTTYALTSRLFDYEELEPADLKGRAEPVPVWRVIRAVAQTGADAMTTYATGFVGRGKELAALDALFEETIRRGRTTLVLVTGEPGIGKSRLIGEFSRLLDHRPQEVTWRQGRCLPYGEGVVFWPLREIVKAQTGILDTDGAEAIQRKLSRALPDTPDKEWLQSRLRPLVGLDAPGASQDENFAAWIRFVDLLARRRPAVLVVEDLHWADDSMLEFLRQLLARDAKVPLLVMTTARTLFLDRAPGLIPSDSERHISLTPLNEEEAHRMVAELAGRQDLRAPLKVSIVERAGGNPLYTEELLRLVTEKGMRERLSAVAEGQDISSHLPASLHAVIAARIDSLPAGQKELLADAAVIGRRFWDGALTAMTGDGTALGDRLDGLAAAELIRPADHSSMAGQREFVFWHAVTRDVAYGQLPRAARAKKHRRVGRWLESLMAERADDLADVLAHHYAVALELARSARNQQLADDLLEPAVRSLKRAGDRLYVVDTAAAERHYSDALRLAPSDGPDAPALSRAHAKALLTLGRFREGTAALDAAAERHAALETDRDALLAAVLYAYADTYLSGRPRDIQETARALLASEEVTFETLDTLEYLACAAACAANHDLELALAERAISMLAELGLPAMGGPLSRRAYSRCAMADPEGLVDLDAGLELAESRSMGRELCATYANSSEAVRPFRGPGAALDLNRRGLAVAHKMPEDSYALSFSRFSLFMSLVAAGEWSDALAGVQELESGLEEHDDRFSLALVRATKALVQALRGDTGEAESAVWAERSSRNGVQAGVRARCLIALATVQAGLGDERAAVALLEDYVSVTPRPKGDYELEVTPVAARIAVRLGRPDLARRCAESLLEARPYDRGALEVVAALLAEENGDQARAIARFDAAAGLWTELGFAYELAQARLGQGRCLIRVGRRSQAASVLAEAREIFARLGAKPALAEVDALISDRA
jgi:class 3 adenylate cyclase/tetratricopeptide (TPR) repeat protein